MIIFMLWMGCSPKKKTTTNCTNLDSTLLSIATATNPISVAKEKGVLVNETQMRIMITLKEQSSPFWEAPAKTELSIRDRHQVLLSPQHLCSISSDARVQSVALPKKPSTKK